MDRRFEIYRDLSMRQVPMFVACQIDASLNTGVIYKNVHPRMVCLYPRTKLFTLSRIGEVANIRVKVRVSVFCVHQLVFTAPANNDLVSKLMKTCCQRIPDAARTACNKDRVSCQFHIVCYSLASVCEIQNETRSGPTRWNQ